MRPAGEAPGAAHRTGDGTRPTVKPALARPTRRQGRGLVSGAGATVAEGRAAPAVGEVGRGRRLGQHGEVVDSI
jgi:hypothetical protein